MRTRLETTLFIATRRLRTRVMLNNHLNISIIMGQSSADSVFLQRLTGGLEKGCSAERSDDELVFLNGASSTQSVQRFVG